MTDLSLQSAARPAARPVRSPSPARSRGQSYGFSGQSVDLKACSAAIRSGSKSFHLASLLLPQEPRLAARSLYAFCRHADDVIDDVRASPLALNQLRRRLDLIYRGAPAAYACDRAFARVVETYAIPKAVPFALLDGFGMDIANRSYRGIEEVRAYATRVASSVGIMMALVMRTDRPEALARAAAGADGSAVADGPTVEGAPPIEEGPVVDVEPVGDGVVVDHGLGQVEDGPVLAGSVLARLACDVVLVGMVLGQGGRGGEPVGIGRRRRTIPGWLRRLVHQRDAGCQFPGCCNTKWTDVHHIIHWAAGGRTDLANLIRLCRFHHTSVHRLGIGIGQSLTDRSWVFATADGHVIEPPTLVGSAETLDSGLGLGMWEGDPARMSHIIDALVLAMADHDPADGSGVSAETPDDGLTVMAPGSTM